MTLSFQTHRYEPPHDKTNKMTMRPAKTQISLGIRPVWSVFAVRMKKAWVLSYQLSAQWRLWSDWADAQADLSLRPVWSVLAGRTFTVLILSWGGSYEQKVQTQVRLVLEELLEEQSDLGMHCLPFRLHLLDTLPYGKYLLVKF